MNSSNINYIPVSIPILEKNFIKLYKKVNLVLLIYYLLATCLHISVCLGIAFKNKYIF